MSDTSFKRWAGALVALVAMAACSGEKGTNGSNGTDGTDGTNALVRVEPEAAGTHCPYGGVAVRSGLDANANGALDPEEVTSTSYVCGGADRVYAASAAPWGGVCPRGGVRLDSGIDADGDGVLDPSELDAGATRWICAAWFRTLSAGVRHACASMSDGTVRCWGDDGGGQLGDGRLGVNTATAVTVNGLAGAVAIAAGASHSCALLANRDRTVRCWGWNDSGQLGTGGNEPFSLDPVEVSGLAGVTQLAAGWSHSCARLEDGTVRCWGWNGYGQLGDGTTEDRRAPVAVGGVSGAIAVAAGTFHSCALLAGGTMQCWGLNTDGQLGDQTRTDRPSPVAVNGIAGAVAIAVGGYHTCAVMGDATVRCWGYNGYGEIGDGLTAIDRLTPALVSGLTGAVAVAAGELGTCALRSDGTVRCWGRNDHGQVGDGTTTDRFTPAVVSGLVDVASLAVGQAHACALLVDGRARCWGWNEQGQLGDGTRTQRPTPSYVLSE